MKNIVLYGERKDRQIGDTLKRLMQDIFTVNYFTDFGLTTIGSGPPINLLETASIREIDSKNCIFILKRNSKVSSIRHINRFADVVVDASNIKSVARLASKLPNVYTCGFSPKDCMTFSSCGDGNVVVSLQRSLRLSKEVSCDPFEIPCEVEAKLQDYTILASVLTLTLCGQMDENISRRIEKLHI